jgi:hypothetical protein
VSFHLKRNTVERCLYSNEMNWQVIQLKTQKPPVRK